MKYILTIIDEKTDTQIFKGEYLSMDSLQENEYKQDIAISEYFEDLEAETYEKT